MTYPPPPNDPHQPGNYGGFGPPQQGFGPPAQPGGPPAGGPPIPPGGPYMQPGGPPMQPGGFGAYPPPPPPPRRNNGKIAAIVVGSVVAIAVLAGVVVAATGDDGDDKAAKEKPRDAPISSVPKVPTGVPSLDLPSASESPGQGAPVGGGSQTPSSGPSSTPSAAPTDLVPYVVLSPGTCFDHPGLDPSVRQVEKRACTSAHDGEVISNATLTGTFSTEKEIQTKALSLCEPAAKARLQKIPAGKTYFYYALYPSQSTYSIRGMDQVSCSLTLSASPGGAKLTEKLPSK